MQYVLNSWELVLILCLLDYYKHDVAMCVNHVNDRPDLEV